MKAYTITTPELNEKTGKTYWHDIGTFFTDDDATGINGSTIKLNMFPNLKIKVYHRDRKQEHHRDTHEQDSIPDSHVDDSSIPF